MMLVQVFQQLSGPDSVVDLVPDKLLNFPGVCEFPQGGKSKRVAGRVVVDIDGSREGPTICIIDPPRSDLEWAAVATALNRSLACELVIRAHRGPMDTA